MLLLGILLLGMLLLGVLLLGIFLQNLLNSCFQHRDLIGFDRVEQKRIQDDLRAKIFQGVRGDRAHFAGTDDEPVLRRNP